MIFYIYRCTKDPEVFIVTDEEHASLVTASLCPRTGELEKVGEYPEMGDRRVAFDETLAKNSIRSQGYFRFEARSFSPVAQER